MSPFRIVLLLLLFICKPCFAAQPAADEGIRFSCQPGQIENIESGMDSYLTELGIGADLLVKKIVPASGVAVYTLNTPRADTSTLDLKSRAELHIEDETVLLPAKRGKFKPVQTVSKKEIMLALLQHGRLTEFKAGACNVQALQEHIGIRQNIVAWSEKLDWIFPNGRHAKWNSKYWDHGTPKAAFPLHEAVNDVFLNPKKYSIGCYTATKLLVIQGMLDYYRRVGHNPEQQQLLENRLYLDNEPLAHIEPGRMWDFEKDFEPKELSRPGKLLRIQYGIAPQNFIPGDWVHLLNTDPVSYKAAGYEGSNPIYLGRNKFADYYNDNDHAYTYRQKVDEVYQWRNGVFSRSRDFAKIKPLTRRDLERLSLTPAQGGLLTDLRTYPYFFGHEALPAVGATAQIMR
jgi:hypothetical protein